MILKQAGYTSRGSDPYLIEVVQELLADQGEALQILSFGGLSLLASLSSEGCLGD